MRQPKIFDHSARRLALMGGAARSLAPVVRDALKDDRVRDALGETYGAGRRMFAEVRGSDARKIAGRVARDADLQHELAAIVRSAARAVDEGVTATRRRLRRRAVLLVTAAGLSAAVVARRRSRAEEALEADVADHGVSDQSPVSQTLAISGAGGLTDS